MQKYSENKSKLVKLMIATAPGADKHLTLTVVEDDVDSRILYLHDRALHRQRKTVQRYSVCQWWTFNTFSINMNILWTFNLMHSAIQYPQYDFVPLCYFLYHYHHFIISKIGTPLLCLCLHCHLCCELNNFVSAAQIMPSPDPRLVLWLAEPHCKLRCDWSKQISAGGTTYYLQFYKSNCEDLTRS